MSIIKDDTSKVRFFMADKADATGDTGKAGLTPADITLVVGKVGANFVAGTGVITAVTGGGDGWFDYAWAAGEPDTFGDLSYQASAAGCFTWRDKDRVVAAGPLASDWTGTRAGKVDNLDAAISTIPTATENAAAVADAAATTPLPAEIVKVKGTPLGVHAGTALDPFGP